MRRNAAPGRGGRRRGGGVEWRLAVLGPSDMPDDEGGLPHALFLEAMDFLTPIWHPARADVEPPELPPRVVPPPDRDACVLT